MSHDYSEFTESPTVSGFDTLDNLIRDMLDTQSEVDELEADLKKAQARQRDLSERQIPEQMDEMGLREFTTQDGFEIKVTRKLRHSLTRERQAAAFRWLEENGHGDIIKRVVGVPFASNEGDEAAGLLQDLQDRGLPVSLDRKVEASTLKALLSQLLTEGINVPLEVFGAFEQRGTKVSTKK